MATRKTAAKKAAKKVVKKAPAKKTAKRAYKRKPKAVQEPVEVSAEIPQSFEELLIQSTGEASAERQTLELSSYKYLDLRELPNIAKAALLMELETQGYLLAIGLHKPSQTAALSAFSLEQMEVLELNNENRLITYSEYSDLRMSHGLITKLTEFEFGVTVYDVQQTLANPQEIHLNGERFVRG